MIVRRLIVIAVLTSIIAFTPNPLLAKKKPTTKPDKPPEISDIVALVSNSLATACAANNCKGLSEIDLTLHAEVDKDGRIGISIFGIDFGGHREKDTYSEFSVKLAPPSENQVSPNAINPDLVSKQLVAALKNFADASKTALIGKFPLEAQSFYLELGFTVTWGGDANTTGLSLTPISPDISGKIDKKNVQTIHLVFNKV